MLLGNDEHKWSCLKELKMLGIPLLSFTEELRKRRKKDMVVLAPCFFGNELALGCPREGTQSWVFLDLEAGVECKVPESPSTPRTRVPWSCVKL